MTPKAAPAPSLDDVFAQQPQFAQELRITKPLLDEFYTQPQLAQELGVTRRTLQRWEELHIGPPMIQIGRRTRLYKKSSVLEWLLSREPKREAKQKVRRNAHA